jgi:hypothetical protein
MHPKVSKSKQAENKNESCNGSLKPVSGFHFFVRGKVPPHDMRPPTQSARRV